MTRIVQADPWSRAMSEQEVMLFLAQPLLMRIALVDDDDYPVAYPVWFLYEDGKFLLTSGRESKKARILRKNSKVYFVIDDMTEEHGPRGVRGKGEAKLVDDPAYTEQIMRREVVRYMGSLENPVAKELLESVKEALVVEVRPKFLAAWIYK